MKKLLVVLVLMSVMLSAVSCSGEIACWPLPLKPTEKTDSITTAAKTTIAPVKTTTQPTTTKAATTTTMTAKSTKQKTTIAKTTKTKNTTITTAKTTVAATYIDWDNNYKYPFEGTAEEFKTQVIDNLTNNRDEFEDFAKYVRDTYCEKDITYVSLLYDGNGYTLCTMKFGRLHEQKINDVFAETFMSKYKVTQVEHYEEGYFRLKYFSSLNTAIFLLYAYDEEYQDYYEIFPKKWGYYEFDW